MLITNIEINVTDKMMQEAGLFNKGKFGIPKNTQNLSEGVVWKTITEMEEKDFDKLEEYFKLNK